MKYCNKCNKYYTDSAIYCPDCGSKLEEQINYDIFGDILESKSADRYNHQDNVIYDDSKNVISDNSENEQFSTKGKAPEILAFLSIFAFFIPIWGTGICVLSTISNASNYSKTKKNVGYLIMSIVGIVLSIVFFMLIIKYGILEEMMTEIDV